MKTLVAIFLLIGTSWHIWAIKIGVVLPLSGPISDYGNDCLAGMKMATEEDKVCSLIVEDNQGDKLKTIEAIRKLISQRVVLIVGPIIPENALAVAYLVDSLNIPLILPATTYQLVTKVSNLVFRLCYTDKFQAKVMAEFAYLGLGKKRFALFIDNGSIYSIELADAFRKEIEELGGLIVATQTYISEETDFRGALLKISDSEPDCIFIPGYYQQVRIAIRQARDLGIDAPIIGGDSWDSGKLLDLVGTKGRTNFYCSHFSYKDPKVQEFRNNYVNRYASEPTSFSALGYDAIKLISSLDLTNTEPETILNGLNGVNNFNGVTGVIDFSKGRDPVKTAVIIRLKGGKLAIEQKVVPD